MKFYSTIRLDVRRAEQIKDGSDVIGNRVRIKVVKNKVAPPFKQAEVDIMYGEGISKTGELLDMAVEKDIIKKSGSWFSYGEDRIGQGRENVKRYLKEHPEMMKEVTLKVRKAYGIATEEEQKQLDLKLDDQAKEPEKDSKKK